MSDKRKWRYKIMPPRTLDDAREEVIALEYEERGKEMNKDFEKWLESYQPGTTVENSRFGLPFSLFDLEQAYKAGRNYPESTLGKIPEFTGGDDNGLMVVPQNVDVTINISRRCVEVIDKVAGIGYIFHSPVNWGKVKAKVKELAK